MVVFRQKNIIGVKSLGEELAEARLALNLTLLSIEKKVGISEEYLRALESGEWQILPGEVYARNFLKRYAVFLGLGSERILKKFKEESRSQNFWPKVQNSRFGIMPKKLFSFPKILRNSVVALGAIMILVYLGYQIWALIRPPMIEVLYPEDNYLSQTSEIKLLGKSEGGTLVTINGEEIMVDREGFFTIDINLNKGLNVIKLEARKKYGKSATVYRSIVVGEEKSPVAAK